MVVRIIWVGKTRNAPIRALIEDYLERLRHMVSCEVVEIRDAARGRKLRPVDRRALEDAELEKSLSGCGRIVALDERGRQLSSPEFSRWLERELGRGAGG